MRTCKKKFQIVILVIFLCVSSGCWDSKDINEKAIVTTIIFDVKDDEIWFYLEIANIEASASSSGGEKSSGGGKKYRVVKGHNKNFTEVRENINRQLDKPVYLSGIRTLVFTEKFATDHLVEYLYRFRADETYRKKGLTVITNEDPEMLYNACKEEDISLGYTIDDMITTLDEQGKSFSRTTARLIENLSVTYTGILVPCIGLQDNQIALVGYSVINGPTLNGFLPAEEAKGTLLLKVDKPEFFYIVPYKDVSYTFDVMLEKRKFKPSYENGKITFDVSCDFKGELMYGDKKTPYNFNEDAYEDVTKNLTTILKGQLTQAVERAQKQFACDYLQFDDEFRIHYPEEFEKMDWKKEFVDAAVTVDVSVNLGPNWMMHYNPDKAK